MPPKKAQKMALSDFLQDSSLGSWADEMDNIPTAPAPRAEDGSRARDFEGRSGYNDFPPRESRYPPREELPLPTKPPYTAFVGNLAFDISEHDVEEFFKVPLKSVKIIKDRDDKPKGFGYVEFETLQGLKEGLAKTGAQLSGRTVRVSVAEPQKEREPRGGFDDDKFSSPWRREGPLPPLDRPPRGGGGGSRFSDAPSADRGERMGFGSRFTPSSPRAPASRDLPPTEAENNSDWRASARPRGPPPPSDRPGPGPRKTSGFTPQDGPAHAADTEEVWSKGSKFSPTPSDAQANPRGKSGFYNRDANRTGEDEPSDWRSGPRRGPLPPNGRSDRSPSESVPSTPTMGRRKLELLPRASSQSTATSPVGSPKAATPSASTVRSNPFGAAKPVDAAAREKEIEDKLTREREAKPKERLTDETNRPPRNERGGFLNRGGGGTEKEGGWRDRRPQDSQPTSGGNSRSASAAHSRTTSYDGGATTPPSAGATTAAKKPFSFAALASEVAVIEGEEDDPQSDEAKTKEVTVE
ncbi:hypothetical protein FRB90_001367 [Tulasnella sp. 427]|nr:hypothetical protein FRB90_001367 [Tulasnella sp. 427]